MYLRGKAIFNFAFVYLCIPNMKFGWTLKTVSCRQPFVSRRRAFPTSELGQLGSMVSLYYLRIFKFDYSLFNIIGVSSMRGISYNKITDKLLPSVEATSKKSSSDGHILIVEGNIGVGKTTLTCQMGRKLNYRIFLEPMSRNPYLTKFYAEPKKYALKMQLWLFRQRCKMYMRAVRHFVKSGQSVLLDRSLFSDYVFATVSHSGGFISNEGYQHYCNLRKNVLKLVPFPDMVVYLNVDPEECHKRIFERGRNCERGISIDYLSHLNTNYMNFLKEMRSRGCEVVSYDWSEYGFFTEVDDDIRNFKTLRPKLDEQTFEIINKKMQDIFNTDPDVSDGSLSEDEVDDDELLELEKNSHRKETMEQPSLKR